MNENPNQLLFLRLVFLPILVVGLQVSGCSTPYSRENLEGYFPLRKGTEWNYWIISEKPRADGIVLGMIQMGPAWRVLEEFGTGADRSALLSGFPLSLDPWGVLTNTPDREVLVRVSNSQYHWVDAKAMSRIDEASVLLPEFVNQATLFLEVPLVPGNAFGETEQLSRPDGLYCWRVISKERRRIKGVRGISPWSKRVVYCLEHRTLTDFQSIDFVPGVGILEYAYHHHGTACGMNIRLRKFYTPD